MKNEVTSETQASNPRETPAGLSLHFKIMMITSSLLFIVFILVTMLTIKSEAVYLREQARKRARNSLTSLVTIARQAYYANQFAELTSHLGRLKNDDPDLVRAEIYNRHNQLEHYLTPSIVLPSDKTIIISRTFFVNNIEFGKVVIEYRVTQLEVALNRIATLLVTGLIAALLLVGLTIHLAVKHIISIPLGVFIEASDEIAAGKLDRETGLRGRNDEIGYLAERFEKMVTALKSSLREVEETNLQLEGRVKDRTAELDREKKRTENIIESLADGLITIDANGIITYCNEAASQLIAMDPRESTGTPLRRLLPLEDRHQRAIDPIETVKSETAEPVECFLCHGERKIPVVVSCSELTEDNAESGAVITIKDITRIYDLNEQIKRSDRLSSLGVLAAGVAHELNNPLSNISTYAQLMLEKSQRDENVSQDWIETVISEAQRGSKTVMKLLEFSRREPVVFENICLNRLIEDSLKLVKTSLLENTIETEVLLPDESACTMGSYHQLQQVVINLLSNSIQSFVQENESTDTSSAPHTRKVKIELLRSSEPDYVWELSITDNGCGMDDETTQKIFNPFFTTKDVGEGTGLGLSVTYGIISEHYGHITVSSAPDKGTEFKVFLQGSPGEANDERG